MRKYFVLLWLLCPVAVLTYHFNYGQAELARELARERLVHIRELEQAKDPDWDLILGEYDKVVEQLPPNDHPRARHQVRLAKAKARLDMLDVAGTLTDLTQLLFESAAASGEDAPTTRAIRETQGKAFYYATSLLRSSGATEDEWRPFAERTRQIFRYLAEHQDESALAEYEQRVEKEFQKSVRTHLSH